MPAGTIIPGNPLIGILKDIKSNVLVKRAPSTSLTGTTTVRIPNDNINLQYHKGFKGDGQFKGYTQNNSIPYQAIVTLSDYETKRVIQTVTSNATTGYFEFNYIDENSYYNITAHDETGTYDDIAATHIQPIDDAIFNLTLGIITVTKLSQQDQSAPFVLTFRVFGGKGDVIYSLDTVPSWVSSVGVSTGTIVGTLPATIGAFSLLLRGTDSIGNSATYTYNGYVKNPNEYRDSVLSDNPIGYWRFNELSGTSAIDSSGNSRNGTYGPLAVLGAESLIGTGYGMQVTAGSNKVFTLADNEAFRFNSGSFTIEFWIKTSMDNSTLLSKELAHVNWPSYQVSIISNKVRITIRPANSSGVSMLLASIASINNNIKHHVVIRFTGTTYSIFIDGVLDSSTASTAYPYNNSADPVSFMYSSSYYEGGSITPGIADELAFYNTALSDARIAAHYSIGNA